MTDSVPAILRSLDGLARRAELLHRGVTSADIRRAWRHGHIVRVRNGVYALPDLPEDIVRALRVGGVLASRSATAHHGLWVPPDASLCVSVPPHCSGLRDPDDAGQPLNLGRGRVSILYDGAGLDPTGERAIVSARTCVVQVIRDAPPTVGLAVLDSAFRKYSLGDGDRAALRVVLPRRCHAVVDAASRSAESGTESAFRWGLIRLGLAFETQKWLTSTIRADFVVAGFIAVECVSFEHHGSRSDYEKDRGRIATIVRLGYFPLEFTYHQVFSTWDDVERTLMAVVLRGPA